ncbi:MAG TPA: TIM barrel protein [Bacillota bacterium]|nr:TIM barrel protein [Bacillota bacterium]
MKTILKCISTIEQLDIELFNHLNLGVEIQDFTEPNLSTKETKEIIDGYKKLFKNFKGVKSLHGPYLDLKPASPDLLIREVSYKRYLHALEIATQLDMDYLIFHSQINPLINEPFISDLNNLQAKQFWTKITRETDYRGTIVIENVFEKSPVMLKKYIETVNRPNIKINLDIGHIKARKAGLEEWIRELKEHIAYIHVHSNDGQYDLHQRPSAREVAHLYRLLAKYNLTPPLALEYDFNNIEEEIGRYLCEVNR